MKLLALLEALSARSINDVTHNATAAGARFLWPTAKYQRILQQINSRAVAGNSITTVFVVGICLGLTVALAATWFTEWFLRRVPRKDEEEGSWTPAMSAGRCSPSVAAANLAMPETWQWGGSPRKGMQAAESTREVWNAQLGAEMPNFWCETTHGNFHFHDFLNCDARLPYTILLSFPKDFMPICTTELGRCEQLVPYFLDQGVKIIGISGDPVAEHAKWSADILYRERIQKDAGQYLAFPIIADVSREIMSMLGILDPTETDSNGFALCSRALFVVGPEKTVRFSFLYPSGTGRSFDEVMRVIDSLKITTETSLGTPVDWKQGERCLVDATTSTSHAQEKFRNLQAEHLPSGRSYVRHVDCPIATKD